MNKSVLLISTVFTFSVLIVRSQDFDGARPSGSSTNGINIVPYYNTNIQLTAITHSASHGILFDSYKPASTVSGSLLTTGNTKHAHGIGGYGGGAGAIMYFGNGGSMQFLISPASTGAHTNVVWGTPKMTIRRDGKVGIGTGSPSRLLEIQGVDPVFMIDATNTSGDAEIFFDTKLDNGGNYNTARIIADAASGGVTPTLNFQIIDGDGGGWNNTLTLKASTGSDPSGNVGIGTTTPSEKLEVNGTIRSREVKIEASPWPDYVFEPDYELMPIEEIEAFIQSNNHLPEIPTASEIEANGVKLGEMNALLLQKIEELTLYTIEQERRIDNYELRIKNLEDLPMANSPALPTGMQQQIAKQSNEIDNLKSVNKQLNDRLAAYDLQLAALLSRFQKLETQLKNEKK